MLIEYNIQAITTKEKYENICKLFCEQSFVSV